MRIKAKFTQLRAELGRELAYMEGNATEIRKILSTFELHKQAMAAEIASTFERLDEKGTEMETLIVQSAEVMRKTTDQVDGTFKVLFDKFRQYEENFQGILSKHAVYDDLVSRRQQQGKGSSSERTGQTEVRGLIHDKDIRMPEFPQKPESTEMFRRWWKDVAGYCETSPVFPCS